MDMETADTGAHAKFVLNGPEGQFDPRTTAHRGDLADIALAGKMFAPHYAEPMPMRCSAPKAMLRKQSGKDHEAISELLHGEDFYVLDIAGDWAWGYCGHDSYVGYVPVHALQHRKKTPEPTHLVSARAALIFIEPDFKSGVMKRLPMGARIACGEASECGNFLKTGKGFVHVRHVQPIGTKVVFDGSNGTAALAEQLIGAPYLWGGRSGFGIDCSGLVQMALTMTGKPAPRDSDQQAAGLGVEIDPSRDGLQRGDLVFWKGHVGFLEDEHTLLHASGGTMYVTREPLQEAIDRIAKLYGMPTAYRRP